MAVRKPKERKEDDLLAAMRRAIMEVLNNPQADHVDRMKAIEIGAKLLGVEAKLREKEGVKRGSFFAGSED